MIVICIYLIVSYVITFLILTYLTWKDIEKGIDVTLEDFLKILFLFFFSPILMIPLFLVLVDEYGNKIIIKGNKK